MLTTILGITGAALVLLAFLLEQANIWKNDDLIYDFVNFAGAGILIIYGILIKGYPFVALNTIWTIFSFKDVIIDLRKKT